MLEGAFSFRGRIGRLNYFLGCLLAGPVVFVAVLVGGVMMATAQRTLASLVFFALLGLMFVIGLVWYSLSLQARRIRDIGWSPLYVIGGSFLFQIADKVVAAAVPALAVGHHAGGTAAGLAVTLGLSLALLFLPGDGGSDDGALERLAAELPAAPTRLEQLGLAARLEPLRPAVAGGPGGAPMPPRGLAVPRKTFGKRGLR